MATPETKKKAGAYGAEQISVLEGLEPVRKRPGMYIGSTGPDGLFHLLREVVDNSFDEAMAGHADEIIITLLPENRVSVFDNGRGIPVEIHKQYKVSALELVLTKLHAGGKFGGESSGYKISGGLHGVGVSVVNALSDHLEAIVERDGEKWQQEYVRGVPQYKAKKVGTSRRHGTTIIFTPDASIFTEGVAQDRDRILDHFRQQCYLTKGIKLFVVDERLPNQHDAYGFYFEGGVASYVRHLNHKKQIKHDNIFFVERQVDKSEVSVGLQYTDDYQETLYAFTNNIINPEGGTHVQGFRAALTRVLNAYARDKGYLKEKDDNLSGDDVREGLTAVISIRFPEPQFEGQTKAKLGTAEVRGAVESVMSEQLAQFLEEHPRDGEAIVGKCVLAQRARAAARAARDTVLRKGALEGMMLPGKLADCSSRDPDQCELYIVEGESAGGCFSGDTQVALADGRHLSFLELIKEQDAGKQNYCYTIQNNGNVGLAPISNIRKTKSQAEVLKVILDDGSEIMCTPDHRFLKRDGTYCEARDLQSDDSLMPLYRQTSRLGKRITIAGYEMVFNPKEARWIFTHLLADPQLVVRRAEKTKQQWTSEFRAKRKAAYNETYLRKALTVLHQVFHEQGVVDENLYQIERQRLNDRSLLRWQTIQDRFFEGDREQLVQAVAHFNHRVKAVIGCDERMDVYDLEVAETHNFALASGVFVHNSAKQGRNREFQAILPLRGKILNVERARLDKMLANNEIKNLVIALGTNIGEMFDVTKLRYSRVVIMTDADVDGSHIRTLLLTLFYRYFPDLIHRGNIYIAMPPLFRVAKGKTAKYAFSEEERDKLVDEFRKIKEEKEKGKKGKGEEVVEEAAEGTSEETAEGETKIAGVSIQRYKGLGEMNPEQLWETTMDPNTRSMKVVNAEDAEKANETFDMLMGSEVAPRKKFIQTNAKHVKNLDV